MNTLRKAYRVVGLVSLGALSGAGLTYYSSEAPHRVHASSSTKAISPSSEGSIVGKCYPEPVNFPSIPWDTDWDHKEKHLEKIVEESVKAANNNNNAVDGTKKTDLQNDLSIKNEERQTAKKARASRHIFLVRHGQYLNKEKKDEDRQLTELGREQALKTGERLKELNISFDKIIHSNMTRAIETANLVSESLPDIPKSTCTMLREGAPCRPEPPSSSSWKVDDWEFFQEGSRIEAAFRKYFYRADAAQEKDSYELIVCHANVIRYFACRALQFPPDGWLRMSIGHCGITWITIRPNGRVSLKSLGDTGHLPPKLLTFS